MYVFNNITKYMCICDSCHNVSLWFFVCLFTVTWQKLTGQEQQKLCLTLKLLKGYCIINAVTTNVNYAVTIDYFKTIPV